MVDQKINYHHNPNTQSSLLLTNYYNCRCSIIFSDKIGSMASVVPCFLLCHIPEGNDAIRRSLNNVNYIEI